MDTVNTSPADSTGTVTGMSHLMEKYTDLGFGHGRVSLRNFGDAGTLRGSAPASSSDALDHLSALDLPLGTKPYTEHIDDFLKAETGQWNAKTDCPESSYIKDDKELNLIMEPPNPDFDITVLESCYDSTERKQQCEFIEESSALISSQAIQQVVVDSSSNFQLDMNQTTLVLPPPRTVSASHDRGLLNFDVPSATHMMSKADISKWVSAADSPFWYQSANEEHAGYTPDCLIPRSQTAH